LGRFLTLVDVSQWNHHTFGAVIDGRGVLWSLDRGRRHVLRLDPSADPPQITKLDVGHPIGALGLDNRGHLFATGWRSGKLSRISLATGEVEWTRDTRQGTGIAVTSDNNLWVTNNRAGTVSRYTNAGKPAGTVSLPSMPTEGETRFWEWDCSVNPTETRFLDCNGDGQNDWLVDDDVRVKRGNFRTSDLVDGVWYSNGHKLQTHPLMSFSRPTTVDLKFKATEAGVEDAALFWISVSKQARVYAALTLNNGSQTLAVRDGKAELARVAGLPPDFVDLSLKFKPDVDYVTVRVNGNLKGSYKYRPGGGGGAGAFLSGKAGAFDHVRIKTLAVMRGTHPTGVAVDPEGKVWVCDEGDEYIHRIDPDTNKVDLSKRVIGSRGHATFGDMIGIIRRSATTRIGSQPVVFDSGAAGTSWGSIHWTFERPDHDPAGVRVRTSNDGHNWSDWKKVKEGSTLRAMPKGRYLQARAVPEEPRTIGVEVHHPTHGTAKGKVMTWDGNGDPNSGGNWHFPANWNLNVVPGRNDRALFPVNTGDAPRVILIGKDNDAVVDCISTPFGKAKSETILKIEGNLTVNRPDIWEAKFRTEIGDGAMLAVDNHQTASLGSIMGEGTLIKGGPGQLYRGAGGTWEGFGGRIIVKEGMLGGYYVSINNDPRVRMPDVPGGNMFGIGGIMLSVEDGAMLSLRLQDRKLPQGLAIEGSGIRKQGAIRFFTEDWCTETSTIAGPVVLTGDSLINIAHSPGLRIVLNGSISGEGALTKIGPGKLMLGGSVTNVDRNGVSLVVAEGPVILTGSTAGDVVVKRRGIFTAGRSRVAGEIKLERGAKWHKAGKWDGNDNAGKSSNWSDPVNWTDDELPDAVHLPPTTTAGRVITFDTPATLAGLEVDPSDNTNVVQIDADTTINKTAIDDGEFKFHISAGKTLTINNSEESNFTNLSGAGTLIKDGPGQLKMKGGWADWTKFTGTFTVRKGLAGGFWFHPGGDRVVFGNANLVVEDGAMVSIGGPHHKQVAASITLNGSGLETHQQDWNVHRGALRFFAPVGKGMWAQAMPITLASDSTISVTRQQFFQPPPGLVADLRGGIAGPGSLTKIGEEVLRLSGPLKNKGGVIVAEGPLHLEGCTVAGDVTVNSPPPQPGWWNDGWFKPYNGQTSLTGCATISGELTMRDRTILFPRVLTPTSVTVPAPQKLTATGATLGAITWEVAISSAPGAAEVKWNTLDAGKNLTLTARRDAPMTIKIITLTETHQPGKLADFDGKQACSWTIGRADTITGFDPGAIVIDDTGIANDPHGNFSVAVSDGKLELRYDPAR